MINLLAQFRFPPSIFQVKRKPFKILDASIGKKTECISLEI